ncbi:MAG TPA: EamA family transporter [Burkholderiales bacterium]|jgi:drug/metabolite transporter (DMT)-like permease|nr:EamA family transporter [Burkholderiales bacterium]
MQPQRSLTDWALLFALVAMWGSSFLFNKLSIATVAPATVVAVRLALGALTLVILLYLRGQRLPPPGPIWGAYAILGVLGNALPFLLIAWGQQVVDSALAGILMAVMPLATLVLAHFLIHGERMTPRRAAGFALGFAGIVFLMEPAAAAGFGGAAIPVLSQLAVLGGALCYAANSVLARLLIKSDFLVSAAGTLLVATVIMVPVSLIVDRPWTLHPSNSSIAAIVWLGLGPTAIATICYFRLISAAGPTFMSLVNYMSPAVAVFLGVTLLGEKPGVSAYAGLLFILAGIALSQWRRR